MSLKADSGRQHNLRSRSSAGFTLIETIVVLGILAVLVALLFMPMYQTMNMLNVAAVNTQAQDSLNAALTQLQQDLEEAQYVLPVALAGYNSPKDEVVLSRLDLFKPPMNPMTATVVYPEQIYAWPAPDPANPATWIAGAGTVVRYFVAPLPDQPAGPMWGQLTGARTGYMNPYIEDPLNATAMGPLADLAATNMSVLYRVQFDLDEPPFNDIANPEFGRMFAPETNVDYPTSVGGPYFYMSDIQVPWGAGTVPLGQVFRDLAQPVTPADIADCGRYFWDDAAEQYLPALWGSGQRGVLPGFAVVPALMSDKVAEPDQTSLPTAPRDAVTYRAPHGLWVGERVDPDNNPATFNQPPAWFMRLQNAGGGIADPFNDGPDPWDDSGLLYFFDSREYRVTPPLVEKQVALAPQTQYGAGPPYYYRMLPIVDEATGTIQFSRRAQADAYFDVAAATMSGAIDVTTYTPTYPLAPADPGSAVNWQYQVTFGRDPVVWPFNNSLFEPVDVVTPGLAPRRFKMVEGSEEVRLISLAAPFREWTLVRTTADPGPGQYRINYVTGVIEFSQHAPPDTSLVAVSVQYDFRDNFRWFYTDAAGAEWEAEVGISAAEAAEVFALNDVVAVTYSTRARPQVVVSVAAYTASSPEPQIVSVTKSLAVGNGPR